MQGKKPRNIERQKNPLQEVHEMETQYSIIQQETQINQTVNMH